MTIRNTAGAVGQQAVALRASGDQQAFANMNLEGYQVSYQLKIFSSRISLNSLSLSLITSLSNTIVKIT